MGVTSEKDLTQFVKYTTNLEIILFVPRILFAHVALFSSQLLEQAGSLF